MITKACSLLMVFAIFIFAGFMNISQAASGGHWVDSYYSSLVDRELLDPDKYRHIDLDQFISRGEFINILMGVFDIGEVNDYERHFNDIKPGSKYFSAAERAKKFGIITGYDYGLFLPDEFIKRQDMFTILGRALSIVYDEDFKQRGFNKDVFKGYYDQADISEYAAEYMDDMLELGIINGYSDGTMRPRVNVTYAETLAAILHSINAVEVLKKEITQRRSYDEPDVIHERHLPIDSNNRKSLLFPEMVSLDNVVNIYIDMGFYGPKFDISNIADINIILNFLRKLTLYSTDMDHVWGGGNFTVTFKYSDGKEGTFSPDYEEFCFYPSTMPGYVYKAVDYRDGFAFEDIIDDLLRSYYRSQLEQYRQSGLPSQRGVVMVNNQLNAFGKIESRLILSTESGKIIQLACEAIYTYGTGIYPYSGSPVGDEFELFYTDSGKTTQEIIFCHRRNQLHLSIPPPCNGNLKL